MKLNRKLADTMTPDEARPILQEHDGASKIMDNLTAHKASEYDQKVRQTIPFQWHHGSGQQVPLNPSFS
jgi:hypothetical protein